MLSVRGKSHPDLNSFVLPSTACLAALDLLRICINTAHLHGRQSTPNFKTLAEVLGLSPQDLLTQGTELVRSRYAEAHQGPEAVADMVTRLGPHLGDPGFRVRVPPLVLSLLLAFDELKDKFDADFTVSD